MGGSSSLIGQAISHYRVIDKLGGSVGVVFRAEDTKLISECDGYPLTAQCNPMTPEL